MLPLVTCRFLIRTCRFQALTFHVLVESVQLDLVTILSIKLRASSVSITTSQHLLSSLRNIIELLGSDIQPFDTELVFLKPGSLLFPDFRE